MPEDDVRRVEPQPQPTPPVDEADAEPESIWEFFQETLGLKSKFKKLKSFLATRQRMIKGEYLFDRTSDQLKKSELMGPLTFNIYSSAIAGTIALGVTKLLSIMLPSKEPSIPATADAVTKEFLTRLPQVDSFIRPFVTPAVFLVIAYCLSWGAIRGTEPQVISIAQTSAPFPSRRRARNAFLYFDGAYGLIPQAVISLAVATIVLATPQILELRPQSATTVPEFAINDFARWLGVISLGLFLVGGIYHGYLTFYKFPKLLFQVNGYYRTESPKPPWVKYIITALVMGPAVVFGTRFIYQSLLEGIAKTLAALSVLFHGKL